MNNKLEILSNLGANLSFDFSFLTLLILALCFAVFGNLFSSTILKDVKSRDIIGVNFLIITGTMLVLSPFFFQYEYKEVAVIPLLWIIVLDMSANYFYFKIFEKLTNIFDSILISLVSTLVFFLGWLFWADLLVWPFFVLAIFLIFVICFFVFSWNNLKEIVVFLFVALFFYFCSSLPSQLILVYYKVMNAPTLYLIRAGAIGILSILYSGNLQKLSLNQYKLIFVRGFFIIGQWVSMYMALMKASQEERSISLIWIIFLGILLLLNWGGIKILKKNEYR